MSDLGGSDSAWMYFGHAVRLGYSVGGLPSPFNGSERRGFYIDLDRPP